jgi:hypothetical protein
MIDLTDNVTPDQWASAIAKGAKMSNKEIEAALKKKDREAKKAARLGLDSLSDKAH